MTESCVSVCVVLCTSELFLVRLRVPFIWYDELLLCHLAVAACLCVCEYMSSVRCRCRFCWLIVLLRNSREWTRTRPVHPIKIYTHTHIGLHVRISFTFSWQTDDYDDDDDVDNNAATASSSSSTTTWFARHSTRDTHILDIRDMMTGPKINNKQSGPPLCQ